MSKNKLTIHRGGAVASKYGYYGLENETALEINKLILKGRNYLSYANTDLSLRTGQVAYKLKALIGEAKFWNTIRDEWFDGNLDDNKRRSIQKKMHANEIKHIGLNIDLKNQLNKYKFALEIETKESQNEQCV